MSEVYYFKTLKFTKILLCIISDLSWRMFLVHLNWFCILLFWGTVFCSFLLGLVGVFCCFSLLFFFWSFFFFAPVNYYRQRIEISIIVKLSIFSILNVFASYILGLSWYGHIFLIIVLSIRKFFFLMGICLKTLSGCLQPWIILNTIYTMFFSYTYRLTRKRNPYICHSKRLRAITNNKIE